MDFSGKTFVFYDGVCGLCNRIVRILLFADRHDRLLFAPLQSSFAVQVLSRHGINPDDLDSVVTVSQFQQPQEWAYVRSDAVLELARVLGGICRSVLLFRLIPPAPRDRIYDLVARNRYRIFGRFDSCPIPKPEDRAKFIEVDGLNR